jgi:hypothetical protein
MPTPLSPSPSPATWPRALKAVNAKYKYTEYPGIGHNSWDQAYAEPDLVSWLLSQSQKH